MNGSPILHLEVPKGSITKIYCTCGCEYFQMELNDITFGCSPSIENLLQLSIPKSRIIRCMSCGKVLEEDSI